MGTSGVETVFIGGVRDSVLDTVGSGVGVVTLDVLGTFFRSKSSVS